MSRKFFIHIFKRLWPQRLRMQIGLAMGLVLMLTTSMLMGYVTATRINDDLHTSTTQAEALARNLAITISASLLTGGYSHIEEMLLLQSNFPGVSSIAISDAKGKPLMHVVAGSSDSPQVQFGGERLAVPEQEKTRVDVSNKGMMVWQPVIGGALIGWLRIEFSLEHLRATQTATLIEGFLIGALALIGNTILFLLIFGRHIRAISEAAEFAGQLNQNRGNTFITYPSALELEQLGTALNTASISLHEQGQNLIAVNADLRNQEEKFRAVSDSANEAIVTCDEQGRIIYLNLAAQKIFGYGADEVMGKALLSFIPDEFHAIYQNAIRDFLVTDKKQLIDSTMETTGRRKDSSEFPVEISLASWKIGGARFYTSVMRDITRRKRGQQALLHLASIVGSSNDSIISETLDGKVTSWNTAATQLYGYEPDEMIDQSIMKLVPPDKAQEKIDFREMICRGEKIVRFETLRIKKSGELVEVAITVSPLRDANNNIIGISTITRDITERKLAEARILELTLIDELTGLHNRRGFFTMAEPQLALNRRSKLGMLLFYADMDGFKDINDTLGHTEGDHALQDMARVLRTTFRDSDIVSRIGGDEFVVIASDHLREMQEVIINRLQDNVRQFNQSSDRGYSLQVSVGTIFLGPDSIMSLDELLAKADEDMYRVKHQRNQKRKS